MFAIIKTGGKQYKVAPNDIIMVERLMGTSGDPIEFTDVLMTGQGDSIKVGAPFVSKATVCGTVLDQIRDDKVIIFKKKKRHNYRRKNGHRQYLTVVRITDILTDGATKKAKPAVEKADEKEKLSQKKADSPVKKAEKAPVRKTDSKTEKTEKAPVKKETSPPKKATKKGGE